MTTTDTTRTGSLPAPARRPAREFWTSPWVLGLLAAWALAVAHILLSDRSVLPLSDQEPTGYFSGIVGATITMVVLFRLMKGTAPVGPDPATGRIVGPVARDPRRETAGLLAWMALVVAVGSLFDIRTHLAFVGLSEGAQQIWDGETARSTLVWAGWNFVGLAVAPFLFFRYRLGYRAGDMLLRFPRPAVFAPYFVVVGTLGFVFALTPEFGDVPLAGHLLTLLLFTVGSFLPIMIVTQSLLTPRLAQLAGSWVTGAVLSALVYATLNVTEAILAFGTTAQVLLSLAWFMQVAFWGLVKSVTTLRTGNAWMHIATTHTIHLAEAPAVASTFSLR